MPDTLQSRLKQLPPFLCFALSRTHTKPLSDEEILRRFKWKNRKVRRRKAIEGVKLPRKRMTRRMLRDEVARKSGLHPRKIGRICFELSWDEIYVGDMLAFIEACGIDLLRMRQVRYCLRHGCQNKGRAFSHLTASQFQKFNALCKQFIESQTHENKN